MSQTEKISNGEVVVELTCNTSYTDTRLVILLVNFKERISSKGGTPSKPGKRDVGDAQAVPGVVRHGKINPTCLHSVQ